MKKIILPLLMSTVFLGAAKAAEPLGNLQWEKRPLLLFSKSRSDASLDKQVDLLRERRPDLRERDVVVLRTAGHEETRSAIGYTPINTGLAFELKRKFKPMERGLTVILIGKDGDEKQRWNRVVQPQEIFDIIDSMPMRQSEINQSN